MHSFFILLCIFLLFVLFFFFKNKNEVIKKNVMDNMMKYCKEGDLVNLKILFENSKTKKHLYINIDYENQEQFIFLPPDLSPILYACGFGHIEIVKYILNSHLFKKIELSQQQNMINTLYGHSVVYDQKELVDYLLKSTELSLNAQFHYDDYAGFKAACRKGDEHILEYFLSSDFKIPPHVFIDGIISCLKNSYKNGDTCHYVKAAQLMLNNQIVGPEQIREIFLGSLKFQNIKMTHFLMTHPLLEINKELEVKVSSLQQYKVVPSEFIEQILILLKSKLLHDKLEMNLPIEIEHKKRIKI